MPVPAALSELSTTPASNSPGGGESITTTDDYLRVCFAFTAQLRDDKAEKTGGNATGTWPIGITGNAATVSSITGGQVTGALGYTPPRPDGTGASGTWGISINGNVVSAVDAGVQVQHSGNANTWYGRVLSRNSVSDRAAFLGTFGAVAGVFAHNHALNEWADLCVNTLDGSTGGAVRLPASTYVGGQGLLTPANIGSYAPSLAGVGASGTWGINITGSAASAASAGRSSRLQRRDDTSDYSVQTYWTGAGWRLHGYAGDSPHAGVEVAYADSAGSAAVASSVAYSGVTGRPSDSQLARAWVNFDGAGVAGDYRRATYNVSSITDNGTGDYTVNFATAMPHAHYAICGAATDNNASPHVVFEMGTYGQYRTASACRIRTTGVNGFLGDPQGVYFAAFA